MDVWEDSEIEYRCWHILNYSFIEAVVLASNPNLFYFVNDIGNVGYYDWLEFKELSVKKSF